MKQRTIVTSWKKATKNKEYTKNFPFGVGDSTIIGLFNKIIEFVWLIMGYYSKKKNLGELPIDIDYIQKKIMDTYRIPW